MTLSEYAIQSLRLDRRLRESSRITAYAVDVLRIAEIMALVTLLFDLTPWGAFEQTPQQRISSVLFFSLFIAALNLVRNPAVEATLDKTDRDAAT